MAAFKFTSNEFSFTFERDGKAVEFRAGDIHHYVRDDSNRILYIHETTGVIVKSC